ncbi:hypothetical protein E2C01_000783 [Portunus trituberculatus]|uniref:Uncharacterized protein n=1 Tax=Portunus trituberculatus TaxID=210409 RepID=A0A5B7CIJ5_PORTR|nr:hypothetical protein [Portunus trituberculatus]
MCSRLFLVGGKLNTLRWERVVVWALTAVATHENNDSHGHHGASGGSQTEGYVVKLGPSAREANLRGLVVLGGPGTVPWTVTDAIAHQVVLDAGRLAGAHKFTVPGGHQLGGHDCPVTISWQFEKLCPGQLKVGVSWSR